MPNFGDDLNEVLWPRLAPQLIGGGVAPAQGFVGIGTIIGKPTAFDGPLNVFSSGVGYDDLAAWNGRDVRYWCVRGPVSARALGLDPAVALADGALLAPLAQGFPAQVASHQHGVVVIPHVDSLMFSGWDKACRLCGFELLDPRGAPEAVIARIASAELVLAESLHGAILADAYGVAWQAFASSKNFAIAKWVDWAASVGRDLQITSIPPPDPRMVVAFGRRGDPVGRRTTITIDDALADVRARRQPAARSAPSSVRRRLKSALLQLPLAGRTLGFSPARTAEALQRLNAADARVTPRATLDRLQGALGEALQRLMSGCETPG